MTNARFAARVASPSSPTLRASNSPSMKRSGAGRVAAAPRSRHPTKPGGNWGFGKASPLGARKATSPSGGRAPPSPLRVAAKKPLVEAVSTTAVKRAASHPSLDGWTIYHDSLRGNMRDWQLALEAMEGRLAEDEAPGWMADNLGRWWSHHEQAVHHHHTMAGRWALPPKVVEDQGELLANMGLISSAVTELLEAAGYMEVSDPSGPVAVADPFDGPLLAYTSSPIAVGGKLFASAGGHTPRGRPDVAAMFEALHCVRARSAVGRSQAEARFAEARADGLPLFGSHFTRGEPAPKLSVWDIVSMGPHEIGLFLRSMDRAKQLRWAGAEGIPLPLFKCLLLPKARQYDRAFTQLLMDVTTRVRPSDFGVDDGWF